MAERLGPGGGTELWVAAAIATGVPITMASDTVSRATVLRMGVPFICGC